MDKSGASFINFGDIKKEMTIPTSHQHLHAHFFNNNLYSNHILSNHILSNHLLNNHHHHHHAPMLADNNMEEFCDEEAPLDDDPPDDLMTSQAIYSQYQNINRPIENSVVASANNKIRKRSANQAYEYLTQLPDSKAFQEWLSLNETDFTWVHKRNSMTNAGKKYYYICNYRIKKGYVRCPAVIYALFPNNTEQTVMVFSCGEHEHRRLGGGCGGNQDDYKEIKEFPSPKSSQNIANGVSTPNGKMLISKHTANYLGSTPSSRYSLPPALPAQLISSSQSKQSIQPTRIGKQSQHQMMSNGSSLMSTSSSSSSSSSSGSATPPPPSESLKRTSDGTNGASSSGVGPRGRNYTAIEEQICEGDEEDMMLNGGTNTEEGDESMLRIDEKQEAQSTECCDEMIENDESDERASAKRRSQTTQDDDDDPARTQNDVDNQQQDEEYNSNDDELREETVGDNIADDECIENVNNQEQPAQASQQGSNSTSSLHGSNSSFNCLTESTNKILNQQQSPGTSQHDRLKQSETGLVADDDEQVGTSSGVADGIDNSDLIEDPVDEEDHQVADELDDEQEELLTVNLTKRRKNENSHVIKSKTNQPDYMLTQISQSSRVGLSNNSKKRSINSTIDFNQVQFDTYLSASAAQKQSSIYGSQVTMIPPTHGLQIPSSGPSVPVPNLSHQTLLHQHLFPPSCSSSSSATANSINTSYQTHINNLPTHQKHLSPAGPGPSTTLPLPGSFYFGQRFAATNHHHSAFNFNPNTEINPSHLNFMPTKHHRSKHARRELSSLNQPSRFGPSGVPGTLNINNNPQPVITPTTQQPADSNLLISPTFSTSPPSSSVNTNGVMVTKCGMPRAAALSMDTAPVHIDVGGCIYTSSLETLTRFANSRITKMFNGSLPIVLDGLKQHYFIDRDGKSFRHVLNFMRTGRLVLPVNFNDFDTLIAEAKFYELDDMVKQLEDARQQQIQQSAQKSTSNSNSPPVSKQRSVYDDLEDSGLSKAKQTALILRSAFSKTASKSWSNSSTSAAHTSNHNTSVVNQHSNNIDDESSSTSSPTCKMVIVNMEAGKVYISGERQCVLKIVPELAIDESTGDDEQVSNKYMNRSLTDLSLVELMERLYSNEFYLEALHSNEYILMCNKSNKF